ncbi:hypothetical protein BS78_04G131000 [Paspalum vaginatum]|nr:hypothetical protein BS78_04G131000 [Paspalum vaginatum]
MPRVPVGTSPHPACTTGSRLASHIAPSSRWRRPRPRPPASSAARTFLPRPGGHDLVRRVWLTTPEGASFHRRRRPRPPSSRFRSTPAASTPASDAVALSSRVQHQLGSGQPHLGPLLPPAVPAPPSSRVQWSAPSSHVQAAAAPSSASDQPRPRPRPSASGATRAFLPRPGGRDPLLRVRSTSPLAPSSHQRRNPQPPFSCVPSTTPAACPPATVGGSASAPAPPRIPGARGAEARAHPRPARHGRAASAVCSHVRRSAGGELECRPPRAGAGLPGRGFGGRASTEWPAEPRR